MANTLAGWLVLPTLAKEIMIVSLIKRKNTFSFNFIKTFLGGGRGGWGPLKDEKVGVIE